MHERYRKAMYAVAIGLGILTAVVTASSALAQDETATEAADQVSQGGQPIEDEADDGFDDWGLLGLLGLLGLAGFVRRPERPASVVDPAANPIERPATEPYDAGDANERRPSDFI